MQLEFHVKPAPSSTGNPICPENFGKDVRTDIDHIIFTTNASLLDQ